MEGFDQMHCTSCGHKIVFALKYQGESRDCEKCSSTQILQPELDTAQILQPELDRNTVTPPTSTRLRLETIRLLRRIEKNTSATHFWTRVTGIPVLIGMIVGVLIAMVKCS